MAVRRGEAGMVSVEAAVAIPAVVAVLALVLSGLRLGLDEMRCLDAARSAARLLARGEAQAVAVADARRRAPAGAVVRVDRSSGLVSVVVRGRAGAPLRSLHVPDPSATATALSEWPGPWEASDGTSWSEAS